MQRDGRWDRETRVEVTGMKNGFLALALACAYCFTPGGLAAFDDFLKPLPPEYLKRVDLKVRRQDNDWVKIIQSFAFEQTPEEFFHEGSDDRTVIVRKQTARVMGERENFRWLQVEVQFLRHCTAAKKKPRAGRFARYQGSDPKTTWELFWADILSPDIDSIVPAFRCDAGTEVFATFYDRDGEELDTKGAFAFAYLIDADLERRKMVMSPGEKTYVWFSVPDDAVYWYEWVSLGTLLKRENSPRSFR
jgi:hypothetical protein